MNSNKSLYAAGFLLGLSGLLIVGLTLGQHAVEKKIRSNIDKQIAKHPDDGAVTYRNVKASFLSRKVSVNGIEYTPAKNNPNHLSMKIDRLEISQLDNQTLVHLALDSNKPRLPKSMRIGLVGMHLTAELLGKKAEQFLAEYQYSELNLSVAMGFKFDREANPTDEQLVNPEMMKDVFASGMKAVALHYADIKYADLGLLKRLDAQLKRQGKPSLAQSAEQMASMMQRGPAKLTFINDAIPKLQDFLTKGGTIALKAQPPKDQTFVELANPMALMDPNAFATQIGLSVEVSH